MASLTAMSHAFFMAFFTIDGRATTEFLRENATDVYSGLVAVIVFAGLLLYLRARRRQAPSYVVVDGSNVLYWQREEPSLGTVQGVVDELKARGHAPVVWFDANVGYKIGRRYMGPHVLARRLGLPRRQVFVAPKGTPADPLLLRGAELLEARIVTNDRFRDWAEEFPQVAEAGVLVRGRVRNREVQLGPTG